MVVQHQMLFDTPMGLHTYTHTEQFSLELELKAVR